MNRKKKQPLGIIVNSVILWIGGALTILGAIGVAILGALGLFTDVFPVLTIFAGLAAIILIFGIAMIVLGWGLWVHDPIAWWIIVTLIALGIIADLASWYMGYPNFIATIFGIILFMGLIHKDTIKAVKPGIDWKGWDLKDY